MATAALVEAAEIPATLVNGDAHYEFVNGQFVEKVMGVRQISLANRLFGFFILWLQDHPVGEAFVEMLYRLCSAPRLERQPDVSIVSYDRWPDRVLPDTAAWEMVPALAVEVVSKTNLAEEVEAKLIEYFANGVSIVWIVHPRQRRVYVYDGPKSVRILDENDILDGGPVLPEFRLPVRQWLVQ